MEIKKGGRKKGGKKEGRTIGVRRTLHDPMMMLYHELSHLINLTLCPS